MPVRVHIRIPHVEVKPRRSLAPRDEVLDAARAFVFAMQYYWLFGRSFVQVCRVRGERAIDLHAIAIDENVLSVAAKPPIGLEVNQVHLLLSHQRLKALSSGPWIVTWSDLCPPDDRQGEWTSEVASFNPDQGDRLVQYVDVFGFGSPFRCLKSDSSDCRPESLPYVACSQLKGLREGRWALWRWNVASQAFASVIGLGNASGGLPDDRDSPLSGKDRALVALCASIDADGVLAASEVASAIGTPIVSLPMYWWRSDKLLSPGMCCNFARADVVMPHTNEVKAQALDQVGVIREAMARVTGASAIPDTSGGTPPSRSGSSAKDGRVPES